MENFFSSADPLFRQQRLRPRDWRKARPAKIADIDHFVHSRNNKMIIARYVAAYRITMRPLSIFVM